MNAIKSTGPTSEKKAIIVKKSNVKTKKVIPVKFDMEALYIGWGLGIVVTGIGVLIIWATKTAPTGASKSTAHSVTQKVVSMLPETTKEILAFIIGGLFILFGVFCIILGFVTIFKYLKDKISQ